MPSHSLCFWISTTAKIEYSYVDYRKYICPHFSMCYCKKKGPKPKLFRPLNFSGASKRNRTAGLRFTRALFSFYLFLPDCCLMSYIHLLTEHIFYLDLPGNTPILSQCVGNSVGNRFSA